MLITGVIPAAIGEEERRKSVLKSEAPEVKNNYIFISEICRFGELSLLLSHRRKP